MSTHQLSLVASIPQNSGRFFGAELNPQGTKLFISNGANSNLMYIMDTVTNVLTLASVRDITCN
jgi:DNA-binding beta-propeller fold protein YncE